jgi:hypothetical protein
MSHFSALSGPLRCNLRRTEKNNAEDWRAQRNKRLGKDRQESAAMNEAMNELASIQATFAQKMSPIPRSHLGFP